MGWVHLHVRSLMLIMANRYYDSDPLFGGDNDVEPAHVTAPPVSKLVCIYGINLDTEVRQQAG